MTILQTLTPELSTTSSLARARRSAPALALCVLGLLAATACGSIENSEDVADLGPGPTTTNEVGARGATSPAQRTPTATANEDDSDTSDVSSSERDDDDLARSGSSSRTRGGGSVRTRVSDLQSDAGDVDAGDVDAGDVDAGEIEIEIEVDAGDAGVAL